MKTLLSLSLALAAVAASAQTFSVIGLPVGDYSAGLAVNDSGQAGGYGTSGGDRASLWSADGSWTQLSTDSEGSSRVNGINNAGAAVGSGPGAVPWFSNPYRWAADGTVEQLATLGENGGVARSINDSGVAVGNLAGDDYLYHAARWAANGDLELLASPLEDWSEAAAINASGVIAGRAFDSAYTSHAVRWNAAGEAQLLNSLPGYSNSIATAINASGWIGGTASTEAGGVATLWKESDAMSLGTLAGDLESYVGGMNDLGMVVGTSMHSYSSQRAFLWTEAGGMIDLNSLLDSTGSGWTLYGATAVSNTGYITGYGIKDGVEQGFLLKASTEAVPEPASLAALSLGGLALLRRRRKA